MDYTVFLQKRKDRAIASILSFKDRECNEYLPDDVSAELRKVILDEINSFCESAVDVSNGNVNDLFVEKLDEILNRL